MAYLIKEDALDKLVNALRNLEKKGQRSPLFNLALADPDMRDALAALGEVELQIRKKK